ncbi:ribosomal protein S12 methylthiotransferase [Alkalithermobacter thermoalcaliphilus JW-YL-7 = DSM 7308]|uniref:Ribosomal protein uS12 methylthiotransferase RimO n=1 Tax=Alkalithermobacter thermoalcaliphilus JW-YL-7 = DSM 7308 TaxID=1121328 RepID=A0A150FRI4_CLOPD|nr:Ribosomal protein S12 methylthiotransferase rimO [[Clostridium] paradoxum JW-YL-7 = DSM 7308]SHK59146.1 ribosomal protein S12 methylthiotransferase [[Clostridium] paradoxum JW-YL-7 = DSM 7308]
MSLKVALESLGCSKNLVDSEIMLGILKNKGYRITGNFYEADIIIVNTCGFIESAKEESINTILELAEYKNIGKAKLLLVSGCLAQRYSDDLKKEIPEIDAIVGTASYTKINEIIDRLSEEKNIVVLDDINFVYNENLPRYVSTPKYMAYLKIAEGCDNNCTYCIIPQLRGRYRSRKIEDLVEEAKKLANSGVKELVVIAQDTTRYGIDIYGESKLHILLEELSKIEGICWIRVMYSYPEAIDEKVIKVIASNEKICNYFDIPIQHCNNRILKLMNRRTTKEDLINKIRLIKSYIPDAILRTSIIVGFPSETKEEFDELKDFIKQIEFDKLGVFTYSMEEGTAAAKLKEQIPDEIKNLRRDELMIIQQDISAKKNCEKVGKIYKVLIDEKVEDNLYCGRSFEDAYEIDGVVYVNSKKDISIGSFVNVKITQSLEYDLVGEMIDEFSK